MSNKGLPAPFLVKRDDVARACGKPKRGIPKVVRVAELWRHGVDLFASDDAGLAAYAFRRVVKEAERLRRKSLVLPGIGKTRRR